MTLGQGMDLFRTLANEPFPSVLPDVRIYSLIDMGQRRTNDRLRYFYRTDTTSVVFVAGTGEYDPPTDCALPVWVRWNGQRLGKTTTEEWDNRGVSWQTRLGAPEEWAFYGRQIVFSPKPTTEVVTIAPSPVVRYVGDPDAFRKSPFAQLAPQHHDLPILYAVSLWFSLPQNGIMAEASKSFLDLWDAGVTAAEGFYAGREVVI